MTEQPRPPTTNDDDRPDPGLSVSAEIGGLNEEATNKVFQRAESSFDRCFRDRADRVELLSGTVRFFVVIGMDRKAQSVVVEESDLGDREAESCMCGVLRNQTWPKPVGGRVAHARYTAASFEIPDPEVREPVAMPEDVAERVAAKLRRPAKECKSGSSEAFLVTAYIDTKGDVITAGIATTTPDAARTEDCLLDLVRSTTFPSPGSYPGKLTITL